MKLLAPCSETECFGLGNDRDSVITKGPCLENHNEAL